MEATLSDPQIATGIGIGGSSARRRMGISSMPAPKDSLPSLVLYNAAASVAILAGLVRGALLFLGVAAPSSVAEERQQQQVRVTPTLADRFRPSRFGRRRGGAGGGGDCRVCLVRFEPESVVNRLPCGHLFHRACLETWLDYDHATCPLCRLRLLPPAADDDELPRILETDRRISILQSSGQIGVALPPPG